jgi:hypothetical protein
MSEKLLPCPFCGGLAGIWGNWRVYCGRCCAEGPDQGEDANLAENIEKWNTRAQTPPPAVLPVVAITDEKILWLAGDHGICMVGEPNSPDRDDYTFDKASILAFARELTENSAASGGQQDRGEG